MDLSIRDGLGWHAMQSKPQYQSDASSASFTRDAQGDEHHKISTRDPQLFLRMSFRTMLTFANVVPWRQTPAKLYPRYHDFLSLLTIALIICPLPRWQPLHGYAIDSKRSAANLQRIAGSLPKVNFHIYCALLVVRQPGSLNCYSH
jgi:hypothetical protein